MSRSPGLACVVGCLLPLPTPTPGLPPGLRPSAAPSVTGPHPQPRAHRRLLLGVQRLWAAQASGFPVAAREEWGAAQRASHRPECLVVSRGWAPLWLVRVAGHRLGLRYQCSAVVWAGPGEGVLARTSV